MTPQEYGQNLTARHAHVGLPDDKKAQEVKCSCGWSFRHPSLGERRAAIREHLFNPVNN